MRIALCLSVLLLTIACSDPPPPQIPLARLDDTSCVAYPAQPIDRACLPRLAAENAPLALEIEERCTTCSASVERCTVTASGKVITLSLDGKSCPVHRECSEVCSKRRAVCRLPALSAGRYEIRYADAEGRVETLEVGAGGLAKCVLDDGT